MQKFTKEYDDMKNTWSNERKILYREINFLRKEVDYIKSLNVNVLESDDEYFEKYGIKKNN